MGPFHMGIHSAKAKKRARSFRTQLSWRLKSHLYVLPPTLVWADEEEWATQCHCGKLLVLIEERAKDVS